MATEAKMGMGIVAILVCAFGFLVYHKFDLKQRKMLQAQIENSQDQVTAAASPLQQETSKYAEFSSEPAAALPASKPDVTAARDERTRPSDRLAFSPNVPRVIAASEPEFDMAEPLQPAFPEQVEPEVEATESLVFDEPTALNSRTDSEPPTLDTFPREELARTTATDVGTTNRVSVSEFDPKPQQSAFDEPAFAAFDADSEVSIVELDTSKVEEPQSSLPQESEFAAFAPPVEQPMKPQPQDSGRALPPVEEPAITGFDSVPEVAETTSTTAVEQFPAVESNSLPEMEELSAMAASTFEPIAELEPSVVPTPKIDRFDPRD